jgi:hypothetical protein
MSFSPMWSRSAFNVSALPVRRKSGPVPTGHTCPARVVFAYYGAPDEVVARNASSHEAAEGGEDGDE